jgi:uncharacterized protein (TIRG00374 family)
MKSESSPRRYGITIGVIVIVVILLAILLDLDKVWKDLRGIDWWEMLVASVFLLVGYVLVSVLWRYILANRPKFLTTFHTDSISFMTTILSPIPAVALRVVSISRTTPVNYTEAIPGMAVDRIIGLVIRIILLAAVILMATSRSLSILAIVMFVVLTGLFLGIIIWTARHAEKIKDWISGLLTRLPRISEEQAGNALSGLVEGISSFGSTKRLLFTLSLSFVMFAFFLIFQYLSWQAMDVRLSQGEMLTLAMAVLVVAPPSAPSMPVVYQGVVIGILALLGITDIETIAAYAIAVWLVQFICLLGLGIWGLKRTDLKLKELVGEAQGLLGVKKSEA